MKVYEKKISILNTAVQQQTGFHDPMNGLAAKIIPEYPTFQLLLKKCDVQNSYATSGTAE